MERLTRATRSSPKSAPSQTGQTELAGLADGVVVELSGPLVDDRRDLGVTLLDNGVVAHGPARRPGRIFVEGLQQRRH